jgi:hypothetical protein
MYNQGIRGIFWSYKASAEIDGNQISGEQNYSMGETLCKSSLVQHALEASLIMTLDEISTTSMA